MATPRKLVENLSEILGVTTATVTVHDRNLSTAAPIPLRTVAGRGRAAARVTATDAANLLIAVVGSESVKDSVAAVLKYGDLRVEHAMNSGIVRFDELPEGHTFAQGLAALIHAASVKEIVESRSFSLKIRFRGPRPTARIGWSMDDRVSWNDYGVENRWPAKDTTRYVGDLERTALVSDSTILYLGATVGDLL